MSSGNVTQRGANGRHQVLHKKGLRCQAACAYLSWDPQLTKIWRRADNSCCFSFLSLSFFFKEWLLYLWRSVFKCAFVHINQALKSLEVLPKTSLGIWRVQWLGLLTYKKKLPKPNTKHLVSHFTWVLPFLSFGENTDAAIFSLYYYLQVISHRARGLSEHLYKNITKNLMNNVS